MTIRQRIRNAQGKEIEVQTTPPRAIKLFCFECMGHQAAEVPRCTDTLCPLYPYRLGRSHTGSKGTVKNLKRHRANPAQNRTISVGAIPKQGPAKERVEIGA
jgi:hypothetical protein